MKYFMTFAAVIAFLFCHVTELNAQWLRTNGPCGSSGSVNSIAIDSLYIFAASNGCIYRSSDKGNSWLLVYSTNSTQFSISSLGINRSYVYAGTNEPAGGYGIFQSSDNGNSWFPNNTNDPSSSPRIIFALAVCDSVILASSAYGGGAAGMFRSTDNGESWTRVSPSGITCYAVQGSNIFAAVGNQSLVDPYGVYFSNDTGATWSATNFPNIQVYSVVANGSIVLAGTDSSIYKSTDNGVTWKTVDSSLAKVNAISISPSGSYVYAGTNNGLFRSADQGETWILMNVGINTNRIYSIAVYPSGSLDSSYVFAGTGGGLFLSTNNGASWTSSGLSNRQFPPSMTLVSTGSILLEGVAYINNISKPFLNYEFTYPDSATVIYVSTDNGSTWTESDSGITGMHTQITSFVVNGSNIFAGTIPGGVFISTNNGTSWTNSSSGMNNKSVYALVSNGSNIFAGTNGGGVNISTNNGLNWSTINSGLTDTTIRALAISGSNFFAGTFSSANPFSTIYCDVFFSSNNGTTWAKIDSQSTPGNHPLIACLSANGSNLIVGTGNMKPNPSGGPGVWMPIGGVYRLTFDGAKWNRSDSALNGQYVTSLVSSGSNIFAGTYTSGVFASPDNGTSWKSISDGLTDSSVVSLILHNSNLFAATSSGVYRRPLSEITSVPPVKGTLPQNYSLEQNYPNPFNPTTTISYTLPKVSLVTLKVYDVLGREVETLVNEYKNIGRYSVTFDGSFLSSGVYFYRFQAGSFTQTKKLILLR